MKNKAYFIKRLAQLKGLDIESEQVKSWGCMSILDLLLAIKEHKDQMQVETPDEDISILSRVLKN